MAYFGTWQYFEKIVITMICLWQKVELFTILSRINDYYVNSHILLASTGSFQDHSNFGCLGKVCPRDDHVAFP